MTLVVPLCPLVNNKSRHLLSIYNAQDTMSEASHELSPLILATTPTRLGPSLLFVSLRLREAKATWLPGEGAEC